MTQIILALGTITPLVCIWEDIHWADEESLRFLRYFNRRIEQAHVLVLASFREEDAKDNATTWEAIVALDEDGVLHRIQLRELEQEESQELVRRGLGMKDGGRQFTQRLHDVTRGTPLMLLETLRTLYDAGTLFRDADGTWQTSFDDDTTDYSEIVVPAQQIEVIQERLHLLDADTLALIQMAAVLGNTFQFSQLHHLSTLEPATIITKLQTLVQRQFVEEQSDHYGFRHDHIRDAAYLSLSPQARKVQHQSIAELLMESETVSSATLAYHFTHAEDWQNAFTYHWQAGQESMKISARQTANEHFESAITILPQVNVTPAQEFEHRQEHLENKLIVTNGQNIFSDLEKWKTVAIEPEQFIETKIFTARVHERRGEFEFAVTELESALGMAQDRFPKQEARIYFHWGQFLFARHQANESIEKSNLAYEKLIAQGMIKEAAQALISLTDCYAQIGDLNQIIQTATESIQLFESIGENDQIFYLYMSLSMAHYMQGQYEHAISYLEQSVSHFRKVFDVQQLILSLGALAPIYQKMGKLYQALCYYEESVRLSKIHQSKFLVHLQLDLVGTLIDIGDYQYVAEILTQLNQADTRSLPDILLSAMNFFGEINQYFLQQQSYTDFLINTAELIQSAIIDPAQAHLLVVFELAEIAAAEQDAETLLRLGSGVIDNASRDTIMEEYAHIAYAAQGLAHCINQDVGKAKKILDQFRDSPHSTPIIQYALALVHFTLQDSAEAYEVLHPLVNQYLQNYDEAPSQDAKDSLRNTPLHRMILVLWEKLKPQTVNVTLAHKDASTRGEVPLEQRVSVQWTITDPRDAQIGDKKERRRHQLQRLFDEATQQDAVPTLQDLATALDTSLPTIKRDLADLRKLGISVVTRGSR